MNGAARPPDVLAALEQRMRELAREEAARPALVHQRSVEQWVGLPAREYLRLARAGAFPSTKERRLVVARTEDVLRVFAARLAVAAGQPANAQGDEAATFARVGARRVAT